MTSTSTTSSLKRASWLKRIGAILFAGVLVGTAASQENEPEGPRELLRLYGVRDEHFARLSDGRPVVDEERDALLRLLFAVRRFPLVDSQRWALRDAARRPALSQPAEHRGEIHTLKGHVTSVAEQRPEPEVAARFDLEKYYRCELELSPSGGRAVVFAFQVPSAWSKDATTKRRASAVGFFFKLAGEGDQPTPVYAARRLAWHPETFLGNLGMDVGLLENVRDRSTLRSEDREAFYQTLAALGRVTVADLENIADQELQRRNAGRKAENKPPWKRFQVLSLFKNSADWRGEPVVFEGTARRAIHVRVEDEDIVQRFGITGYYEVEVFVDLGAYYKLYKDSDKRISSYPLVFCLLDLPEGMPRGDRISQAVRVPGLFFKIWTYESQFAEQHDKGSRQMAPLLVGRGLTWYSPEEKPATESWPAIIAGTLFLLALAGVWYGLWRYSRGDKEFRATVIDRQFAPEEGVSLDDLKIDGD